MVHTNDEMNTSALAGNLCQVFSIFFAILVRIVLAVFSVLTVMVVVDRRDDTRFWALTVILSLLLLEGAYTVVTRRGQERKWVCLCFVCYLLATVPSVWLLELQKLGLFKSRLAQTNTAGVLSNLPGGLNSSLELESDEFIFILENCLVFLLILCRWLLPRGEISRDQLSQLLFVFIGMASDVMELFQLFEEEKIKKNRKLTYIILTAWTVSLFQFCLVLTMSKSPKKSRVNVQSLTEADQQSAWTTNATDEDSSLEERKSLREYVTQSEIWSLMVALTMQDGPYLAIRLYVVIELNIINSTTMFFVLKNAIVILLLAYRLAVVCLSMAEDGWGADKITARPVLIGQKSGSYDVTQASPEPREVTRPSSTPAKSSKSRLGSPKVAPSD